MADSIVRGHPITLDLFSTDGAGQAVDPDPIAASILDPNGAVVVSLDAPTRVALGHHQYTYTPAGDAQIGAWAIRWFGTINGVPLVDDDGFTVLALGSLTPGTRKGETCTPWATHEDAFGPCATYDVDPDLLDDCMQVATDVLYNLTSKKWPGICTDKIFPQAQWHAVEGPPRWWPRLMGSSTAAPFGWCSCHRGLEYGCVTVPAIRLPNGPVDPTSITILIDGEEFTDFQLTDHRWLTRTDHLGGWPCCQANPLVDGEGCWSVAYSWGRRPPIGGVWAAAAYGCQIAMSRTPSLSAKCALPKLTQSVTRTGTTVRMLDPNSLLDKGRVGLVDVDTWVNSINLGRARRPPTIIRPGQRRSVRRVQS